MQRTRREFIRAASLGALGLALSACTKGSSSTSELSNSFPATATATDEAIIPTWENTPFVEWTPEMAELARVAEWQKLKGDPTKLTDERELLEEPPAVTQGSTYAVFTGHGNFSYAGEEVNCEYGEEVITSHIVLFRNLTENPITFTGNNMPEGGSSIVEYNSGTEPHIYALAGLPLLDPINHHCGYDCGRVVITAVLVEESGEVVRKDYEFNRSDMKFGN